MNTALRNAKQRESFWSIHAVNVFVWLGTFYLGLVQSQDDMDRTVLSAAQPQFMEDVKSNNTTTAASLLEELKELSLGPELEYTRIRRPDAIYRDHHLRELATLLENLDKYNGTVGEKHKPDAGNCASLSSNVSQYYRQGTSSFDPSRRLQAREQILRNQQIDFLSNCTRASKVEFVFLGDDLLVDWDAASFEHMYRGLAQVCANLGIPGKPSRLQVTVPQDPCFHRSLCRGWEFPACPEPAGKRWSIVDHQGKACRNAHRPG